MRVPAARAAPCRRHDAAGPLGLSRARVVGSAGSVRIPGRRPVPGPRTRVQQGDADFVCTSFRGAGQRRGDGRRGGAGGGGPLVVGSQSPAACVLVFPERVVGRVRATAPIRRIPHGAAGGPATHGRPQRGPRDRPEGACGDSRGRAALPGMRVPIHFSSRSEKFRAGPLAVVVLLSIGRRQPMPSLFGRALRRHHPRQEPDAVVPPVRIGVRRSGATRGPYSDRSRGSR